MGEIIRDRSGTLRSGLFFEFGVAYDDSLPYGWSKGDLTTVSARHPTDDELALKQQDTYMCFKLKDGKLDVRHDCPKDPQHETARYWSKAEAGQFCGNRLSSLIPRRL